MEFSAAAIREAETAADCSVKAQALWKAVMTGNSAAAAVLEEFAV